MYFVVSQFLVMKKRKREYKFSRQYARQLEKTGWCSEYVSWRRYDAWYEKQWENMYTTTRTNHCDYDGTWLYILADKDEDYFYVGSTCYLSERLLDHVSEYGCGSECTKGRHMNFLQGLYKIDILKLPDHEKENKLTLDMMKIMGDNWWRVRGGSWCQTVGQKKPMGLDTNPFPELCFCRLPLSDGRCPKLYNPPIIDGLHVSQPCNYLSIT